MTAWRNNCCLTVRGTEMGCQFFAAQSGIGEMPVVVAIGRAVARPITRCGGYPAGAPTRATQRVAPTKGKGECQLTTVVYGGIVCVVKVWPIRKGVSMPSSKDRQRLEVTTTIYERLQAIAETEDRTIA